MKNTICITSEDPAITLLATAVRIRNEFLQKGFSDRSVFLKVVCDQLPEYKEYDEMKKLTQFWLMRLKNEQVNRDLELVLDNLKAE